MRVLEVVDLSIELAMHVCDRDSCGLKNVNVCVYGGRSTLTFCYVKQLIELMNEHL